eukprot:COSAG02_NODE_29065_length_576_cov_1.507338_1_plen_76_part_00
MQKFLKRIFGKPTSVGHLGNIISCRDNSSTLIREANSSNEHLRVYVRVVSVSILLQVASRALDRGARSNCPPLPC